MSIGPELVAFPSDARPAFISGAVSDVGCVREVNEDGFLVRPDIGLWAVADGMGGHDAGALASATVIAALASIGAPASAEDLLARFEDRILRANSQLNELARARGAVIGSTVAVLLVHETYYACVWSGDSRIYLIRAGGLAQISRDHTEAEELVAKGVLTRAEARTWPRRNVITRAIGAAAEPELELEHGFLEPGDTFVLCSDGLTAHVEDAEILGETAGRTPQEACDSLLAMTLQRGAADNVTVVIASYAPAELGA